MDRNSRKKYNTSKMKHRTRKIHAYFGFRKLISKTDYFSMEYPYYRDQITNQKLFIDFNRLFDIVFKPSGIESSTLRSSLIVSIK